MNVQEVLVALLLFLSALIAGGLASLVARKRDTPGVLQFLLLTIALAEWSITYGLEILSRTIEAKTLWAQFQYIGIAFVPVGWFLFAHAYSGNENWANRQRVLLILIIPVITILAAFTNAWHGLIWAEYRLNTSGLLSTFQALRYGTLWWIFFIYSYTLLFWGSVVILRSHRRRGKAYRRQFFLILFSLILPWLANALYLARLSPAPQLDLGPFAFTISAVIFAWGMFRFRLFDLVLLSSQPVINRLDVAAFVMDLKDRIIEINPAAFQLLSEKKADPIGLSVDQAFGWWSQLDPEQRKALNTQHEIAINKDGMRRYFNLQITPIWNSHSKLTGRFVILRDITGDKLADQAMALAQVKTEFLAKVSHELRSPLTSILGISEMLDYGVYGQLSEDQKSAVKMIYESTQQMTRMVNDLLQQSRLERGTFRLDITSFDVSDLLDRLSAQAKPVANLKKLDYIVEISPDMPKMIRGDSLRLYQVFTNLIENAIKYTHKGRVVISVFKVDEQRYAFQVSDTGVGIPKELQRIIFNPFQQVNPLQGLKESGFGLGLSIVKQLISLLAGEIKLVSEVGKGSTFTVILPFEPAMEVQG